MTRRRHPQRGRQFRTLARKPAPLVEGKVRCAGCGTLTSVTKTGKLRRHSDADGVPCPHLATYTTGPLIDRDNLPPVVIPKQPRERPRPREPRTQPAAPEPEELSRLDGGSSCVDCGRWLPGERSVCGRCWVHRNANRNQRSKA